MQQRHLYYQLFSLLLCCIISTTSFRFSSHVINKGISRLQVAKYDPAEFIQVKGKKPLGISLQEIKENEKLGVTIEQVELDSPFAKNKLLRKGLYLLKINNKDVKFEDFDTIIDTIIAAPANEEIELTFIDPRKISIGPADVIVQTADNREITISTVKGQNLRTLLLGSNIEVYDLKGKFSNCGGGGICGTCVVEIEGNDEWEEKPDFEKKKLRKYSDNARLSCNTVVEGDCKVRIQPKPKPINEN